MADEKNIETIIAEVRQYIDNRLAYIRLSILEKTAKFFARMVSSALVAICFVVVILLASITLAFYLSSVFGSYTLGFGVVTLIYALVLVAIIVFRNKYIEQRLANFFIKTYFNKVESNTEDEK